MTVIVLSPGVMTGKQLRRILFSPDNRQLVNVYDVHGKPLFQCRGDRLRVFATSPERALKAFARNPGAPLSTTSALAIARLQKEIMPDVLTSYREHLEHVRRGDMPGTLADPRWGQLEFRFVLARPLQQRDGYPVQEYPCKLGELHAQRTEKAWRAALWDLRVKGYTPGIRSVDVFVDTPALPRAGLYALGVNIGMHTRGRNASFKLHNNPHCFLRATLAARDLRLGWNTCKPLAGNIVPGTCPDTYESDAPGREPAAEAPDHEGNVPASDDSPLPPEESGGAAPPPKTLLPVPKMPPATNDRRTVKEEASLLPPADGLTQPVTEMMFIRVDGKPPAPSRASARLLTGRAMVQLKLAAPDGAEMASSIPDRTRTILDISEKEKSNDGSLYLVLLPENEACTQGDIVAVEVRTRGVQGEFLGLVRHFRRLSKADCRHPPSVILREARR